MSATFIATFGYIGFLRPAPGTWGSLAAVIIAVLLFQAGWGWAVPLLALAASLAGFWAVPLYLEGKSDHDPSEVVIDEAAGQWIALSFTFIPLLSHGVDLGFFSGAWPGWLAPFLLFRLFDITKPSIIGKADRRNDAKGVMLDDIYAGFFAGICSVALAGIYHILVQPWLG